MSTRNAKEDILELLARAYAYDDKPHRLYSLVRQLALKYAEDASQCREIVRLMDIEYSRDRPTCERCGERKTPHEFVCRDCGPEA